MSDKLPKHLRRMAHSAARRYFAVGLSGERARRFMSETDPKIIESFKDIWVMGWIARNEWKQKP